MRLVDGLPGMDEGMPVFGAAGKTGRLRFGLGEIGHACQSRPLRCDVQRKRPTSQPISRPSADECGTNRSSNSCRRVCGADRHGIVIIVYAALWIAISIGVIAFGCFGWILTKVASASEDHPFELLDLGDIGPVLTESELAARRPR